VVAEKSKPSHLELKLDLARWLPSVKSVLSAALIDPQAFALPGVDASDSRITENIDVKYLTQLSLFGNDTRSELKRRLFDQLQDPDISTWNHFDCNYAKNAGVKAIADVARVGGG
jgi:hypothetical protein